MLPVFLLAACGSPQPAPTAPTISPPPQDEKWVHTADAGIDAPSPTLTLAQLAHIIQRDMAPLIHERVVLDLRTDELVALCGGAAHGLSAVLAPMVSQVSCRASHGGAFDGVLCLDVTSSPKVILAFHYSDALGYDLVSVTLAEHPPHGARIAEMWKLVDAGTCP